MLTSLFLLFFLFLVELSTHWSSQQIQICGHGEETITDNYFLECLNTLLITNDDNLWTYGTNRYGQLCNGVTTFHMEGLKKHYFQTSQKYQLVLLIHYFKTTKEKYFHVVIIKKDNVDWVILILLKSHQISFLHL